LCILLSHPWGVGLSEAARHTLAKHHGELDHCQLGAGTNRVAIVIAAKDLALASERLFIARVLEEAVAGFEQAFAATIHLMSVG
jgi:hypothetical protein